ncbi:hypothetical protein [Gemmata sp.]|uniref:hypothetical protein n=1 Tax=Gemmata sp. TaxID=1914242 RepID=UPI003F70AE55
MPTVRQCDVPPDVWAKLMAAVGDPAPTGSGVRPPPSGGMVAATFVPPGTWVIPLHLAAVTNGPALKRGAIGRAGRDRRVVAAALAPALRELAPFADAAQGGRPVRCRITRLGGGLMDDDNLPPTAKWVRDTVALFLGVGDGPRGPVQWKYDQEPGDAAGVRVELSLVEATG